MVNEELPISSARDLSPLYKAFTEEDDEDGNPIFDYSSFGYITHDHVAYFGRSDLPKRELNQRVIRESLQRLPDEDVYPETTSNMTIVSSTRIDGTLFLKRSK
jgi:hypothetical protein